MSVAGLVLQIILKPFVYALHGLFGALTLLRGILGSWLDYMLPNKRPAEEAVMRDSVKRLRLGGGKSDTASAEEIAEAVAVAEEGLRDVVIDEDLHSRQLAVYGRDTMRRLFGANVLISGLKGLGVEIAKNITLAGVKSVTLHDQGNVEMWDMSANFYFTEDDIGKNRALACVNRLQELNLSVAVSAWTSKISTEQLSSFQVVVFTDTSLEKAIEYDNYCHNHNPPIAFIKADINGLFGSVFCDFGPKFRVIDMDGEEPHTGIIASISNDNPALVSCVDDERLDFEDGDLVVFTEVHGMTELNDGKPRRVKNARPYSFCLEEDTTGFGVYEKGGIVTQVKQPKVLHFKPLKEALQDPGEFLLSDFAKFDRPPLLHLAFQALDKFVSVYGHFPAVGSDEDSSKFIDLCKETNETSGNQKLDTIDDNVLRYFASGSHAVLNPMAAMFGGIVGQEVVKACSGKFHPLFQFFYFDSLESLPVEPLQPEDVVPMNSRYDAQVSVFGRGLQRKLEAAKLFVVGAGALGCEILPEMAKTERRGDGKRYQYRGPPLPTLEPQILFKYPPGKRLAMRSKDLPAFCFPGGVKARLMERTPSMSDLNEVVYGQDHLNRDDLSFVFSLKVADNAALYGICVYVQEIVQRPPGILSMNLATSQSFSSTSRFLVSAPRCYCILTKFPFFELHYEVLNSIIAQERLDRITQFVNEMTLTDYVPPMVKVRERVNGKAGSPTKDNPDDWMASAIPVDSVLGATAAAAGLISESKVSSFSSRASEPESPESASASEASEFNQVKEWEREFKPTISGGDDYISETLESFSDSFEKVHDAAGNGQHSSDIGTFQLSSSRAIERIGSSESIYSSIRSVDSDDDDVDDEVSISGQERNFGDDGVMEWAKTHKNDLLQIICGYHALSLPQRGTDVVFQPLEHLQPLKYYRPGETTLKLMGGRISEIRSCKTSLEIAEVNASLAAGEEALALSVWTVATVCRALSLESVLALLAGALLEKQMVVVCPNLGILSAVVLSLIPMIRPFEWQSLLLPVLPKKMLDFLDAPVPFIVGIPHKTSEVRSKTSNLIRVNVYKDQVKMCSMPPLPRQKELASALEPIHAKLAAEGDSAGRRPPYKCNDVQAKAAEHFLAILKIYLESFCSNLRSHTITNVQSNNDRVSLLLKDSFIDSFPSRDQPFIKLLVETQLFSVLTDAALSSHESD